MPSQTQYEPQPLPFDKDLTGISKKTHEHYFNCLGGDGVSTGSLVETIKEKFGSLEDFIKFFSASGMAMRGWVVLVWDTHISRLKIYGSDAHNQGGVWGCFPIIVLDVYEHSYFVDYGSDRAAYIADFWKNFNWDAANKIFNSASQYIRPDV